MYKQFTADDFRKYLGLDHDYSVDGFLIFGSYSDYHYQQLYDSLTRMGYEYEVEVVDNKFLKPIAKFKVDGKRYWFVVAYGGALLSEFVHLASMFGSKKNILLGYCGGLSKAANSRDIIIPTWSYAEESSAKLYQPDSSNKYFVNEALSQTLSTVLSEKHKIHRGQMVTCQAMLGETKEDILRWESQQYLGVEMESATVFAVSKHFGVPATAALMIAENLVHEETVFDINYESGKDMRTKVVEDMFDAAVSEMLKAN